MSAPQDNLSVLYRIKMANYKALDVRERVMHEWVEFCKEFPSSEHCWNDLISSLQAADLLLCRECGKVDLEFRDGRRIWYCPECSIDGRVTAGTFFQRVRKLRPWYAAMWLCSRGVMVSASWFADFMGIAKSTSFNIFQSILFVAKDRWGQSGAIVSTRHFAELYVKRSIASSRFAHPSLEENDAQDDFWRRQSACGSTGEASQYGSDENSAQSDSLVCGTCNSTASCLCRSVDGDLGEEANSKVRNESIALVSNAESVGDDERIILEVVSRGKVSLDQLVEISGFDVPRLNQALTMLEFAGSIRALPGGFFELVSSVRRYEVRTGLAQLGNRPAGGWTGNGFESQAFSFFNSHSPSEGEAMCKILGCQFCLELEQNPDLLKTDAQAVVNVNVRTSARHSQFSQSVVLSLISFVRQLQHMCDGISRRRLELYLAHRYLMELVSFEDNGIHSLLHTCLDFGPVEADQLRKLQPDVSSTFFVAA